jgi:carbon monoxide dehydrogenase subunit G
MKIEGEHRFEATAEQVWAALHDPAILARALPGARRVEATATDAYALTVDVGVGSVKGTYEGTFALTDDEVGEACTVRASATGRPGSVETIARMRLAERDGGALLTYEADATVTGPLAGVGQRLVGGAARRTTAQFLSAVDQAIAAPEAAPAAVPGAPAEPAAAAVARPAAAADGRVIAASALAGAAAALLGVAVGRWTARR